MRCHPRPSESCDFNSRLREETNPAEPTTSFSTKLISNHVSARRRTPFFKCSLNALSVLQLTSSQRDEHFSSFNSLRIVYFNSRLCKETNAAFALLSPSATISIHVSARRRTKIITQIKQIYLISTHVSARRRTSFLLKFFQSMVYYNSRLRKETNRKILGNSHQRKYFKSRLLSETNHICICTCSLRDS